MAYKQQRIPCPDPGCKNGTITILHPVGGQSGLKDHPRKVRCRICDGKGTVIAPGPQRRR
jgi:hypothetical protein